ncbi:hypothetical protein GCM10011575_29660 [Microlunatus endophyticus]|uniref:Zinc-ribbon domain-containing protein n=1 Tax=Microlunatus endophyticus TaxID=1716077 RepID=A0A917W6Q3_9ACTN|nr:zinc ribbon domain-containing protein [Microlunatus endophyticus]GGL69100.1 hypothetical protein GCM10011575_29660 [Microlunatus endophyticus]
MPEYLICPQCRAANPPGSQFCAQCGWAPTPDPQPAEHQGQNPQPASGQPEFQAPYAYGQSYNQPYPEQAPAGQPTPYRQPVSTGQQPPRRDRRLTLMILAGALAVVVIAALAVVIIPRVANQASPAPQPVPAPPPSAQSSAPQPSPSRSATASTSPTPASPTPSRTPDYGRFGAQVSSGILEIVGSGCLSGGGSMVGSAFLINNRTAVAALSSLAGADVIAVSNGSDTFAASVAGTDLVDGLVILKLDHPVSGHVFPVDAVSPAVGDPVGSYGIDTSTTKPALVKARVQGTGAAVKLGSYEVKGLASTTAVVDNGISGAPTLAANGHANGMVLLDSRGRMMIVSGKAIKEAVAHPSGSLPATHCKDQRGPSSTTISVSGTKPVDDMFVSYFTGINSGDYRSAFGQLSSQLQATGYSNYAKGWATSYDFNIKVRKATGSGAHVTFDSIFAKGKGPSPSLTCARWDIDYTFTHEGGKPVINKAEPHSGSIWKKC